jgi:two-component system, cell cycle sensor histidine kinase and response regulator CckA
MTGSISPKIARDSGTRVLAHDFSNLLTAIIGAAESALDRCGIDVETRADIEHIREGARRAGALIQHVHPNQHDSPSRRAVSVSETIRATSRLLGYRLGTDIPLTLDLAETDDISRTEPSQLDRALLNLIANARYAMKGDGTVTLRTERRLLIAASPCVPDTIPAGDYLVIAVADSGIGVARNRLSQIFDSGVSSRHNSGGTGLGLSSVRDIVRDAKGFLAIESIRERGTSVRIFLPRYKCASPPPKVGPSSPTAFAGVVLLVEDDPLVRQVTEHILRRTGWTVLCAASAEVALEVSAKSAYDLMITDLAMQGMDGLTLTRRVLARCPGLPVILTSGYAQGTALDGLGSACVTFLTKPYGRAELLGAVSGITQRKNRGNGTCAII